MRTQTPDVCHCGAVQLALETSPREMILPSFWVYRLTVPVPAGRSPSGPNLIWPVMPAKSVLLTWSLTDLRSTVPAALAALMAASRMLVASKASGEYVDGGVLNFAVYAAVKSFALGATVASWQPQLKYQPLPAAPAPVVNTEDLTPLPATRAPGNPTAVSALAKSAPWAS